MFEERHTLNRAIALRTHQLSNSQRLWRLSRCAAKGACLTHQVQFRASPSGPPAIAANGLAKRNRGVASCMHNCNYRVLIMLKVHHHVQAQRVLMPRRGSFTLDAMPPTPGSACSACASVYAHAVCSLSRAVLPSVPGVPELHTHEREDWTLRGADAGSVARGARGQGQWRRTPSACTRRLVLPLQCTHCAKGGFVTVRQRADRHGTGYAPCNTSLYVAVWVCGRAAAAAAVPVRVRCHGARA